MRDLQSARVFRANVALILLYMISASPRTGHCSVMRTLAPSDDGHRLLASGTPGQTSSVARVPQAISSILAQQQQQQQQQTDTTAATAAATTPSVMDPIFQYLFAQHNSLRAAHGSPPLVWDNDLVAEAAAWAQQCAFGHNLDELLSKYEGENIASSSGTSQEVALQKAVDSWYAESVNYDWDHPGQAKPGGPSNIEHFTQLVWRGTTKIGCAVNFCPVLGPYKQAWYTVCRYFVIGNWDGNNGLYFAQNVSPLGSNSSSTNPAPSSPIPLNPEPTRPSPNPNPQNPSSPSPPLNPKDPEESPSVPLDPAGLVLPKGPMTDNMAEGIFMQAPACIASPNGVYKFCLLLQDKPQLVLINGDRVSWRRMMPAGSKAPYHIYVYPDGWVPNANLVVKDGSKKVVWSVPKKAGQKSPYRLMIRNNGRLTLTGAGKTLWSLQG